MHVLIKKMATSSTILRVKRRLEDNPQDALVLMCKRIKTDSESEIAPSLFVFRGTVENQENKHVKKISSKDFKITSTDKVNDVIEKIRQERKKVTAESRYEIVNCSRGVKDIADEADLNLVDLKKKEENEDNINYAYDLYTAVKKDFDIDMLDNLVSIENLETDLIFGSYRDNGLLSSEGEESDDSNDENNWRNDYPDSDHSSIEEDDIIKAVERIDLEDDLSSDAGEDKIYDEPPDLFNEDAKRYGEAYAKYKARVLTEQPDLADSSQLVHCNKIRELDEESVDGYKEDSDDGFYYGAEQDTDQFKDQYRQDSSDECDPD